uniref:Transmembrane protein 106A n=1 Tax=Amphilophus citrinellus TaxID=61819 RepID=A0A3Q0S332_AMPCI
MIAANLCHAYPGHRTVCSVMVAPGNVSSIKEDPDVTQNMEKVRTLLHFPPYGAMDENPTGDTCPTCRGTGKIPREHEDQLVAVIPCNDVRLKPRHTKLYVCISMALCLFVCCLILFFLFPRSVTLTPVSVLSVMVYFMPDKVEIEVTNLINITNDNYYPVEIVNFSIQPVVAQIAIEKTKISNTTAMQPRSQKSVSPTLDELHC